MKVKVYRNEDVKRVIAFIPKGHKHIRLLLELKDQIILFQEATIAGIARAYLSILLHPQRRAVELIQKRLHENERKQGYAEYQLIETNRIDSEVLEEVSRIIEK